MSVGNQIYCRLKMSNSMIYAVALLATFLTVCSAQSGNYEKPKACNATEQETFYHYDYSGNEDYFGKKYDQSFSITVKFFIHCLSVGEYNGIKATLYELNVTSYTMGGNIIEKPGNPATDIDFSQWFQFVKTKDGSIPLTFYDREDDANVVNIKKAIASTFQCSAKHTVTEADPQSEHESVYSFYASLQDKDNEVLKMTRTVTTDKVKGYAQHIPRDEVELKRVENLEFTLGKLTSATGSVDTKMMTKDITNNDLQSDSLENERQQQPDKRDTDSTDPDDNTYDDTVVTNYYQSTGKYKVSLVSETVVAVSRQRRSVDDDIIPENAFSSSLLVYINQTERVILRMVEARNSLGDIEDSLSYLYYHPKDIAIAHTLEKLIKLEAEYGSILDYPPAIDDVLEYLANLVGSNNTSDKQMRYNIYFMITPDGSLSSQMALLDCYKVAVDDDERDTLVMYLSSVAKPKPRFVVRLEHMISSDVHSNDPLLLAYGSLYPAASSELQHRIFIFLFQRLSNSKKNPDSLVHHILSLGNTASPNMSRYLVEFLNHDQENVKLSAILAMRFIMNQKVVLNALKMFMYGPTATEDHLIMIVKALIYGLERSKINKEETPYSPGFVEDLVNCTAYVPSPELSNILNTYLQTVNNEHSKGLMQVVNSDRRFRRDKQWDADKSEYNLVEPLAERQSDVKEYTHAFSYIWGKKFGGKDINVQIAAGAFAGVGNKEGYKLYGHAVAKAHCYDYSLTMLEFLVLRKKNSSMTLSELYAVVMGKTVKKYQLKQDPTVCKTIDKPIYEAKDYSIFDFTYSIFVVVGTLDFTLSAKVHFTSGLYVEFCESPYRITAGAGLSPTITFIVAASGDLQVALVAKAGLTLSATLNYQLLPEVTSDMCYTNKELSIRNCLGIYHQWDDNAIDMYAWYAWRGWCGWFVCTGKDAFKKKHKIDAISLNWKLAGSKKKSIFKKCDKDLVCDKEPTDKTPTDKAPKSPIIGE